MTKEYFFCPGNELQQWIHIMIKAKRNIQLEGLYVQAIHGPVNNCF